MANIRMILAYVLVYFGCWGIIANATSSRVADKRLYPRIRRALSEDLSTTKSSLEVLTSLPIDIDGRQNGPDQHGIKRSATISDNQSGKKNKKSSAFPVSTLRISSTPYPRQGSIQSEFNRTLESIADTRTILDGVSSRIEQTEIKNTEIASILDELKNDTSSLKKGQAELHEMSSRVGRSEFQITQIVSTLDELKNDTASLKERLDNLHKLMARALNSHVDCPTGATGTYPIGGDDLPTDCSEIYDFGCAKSGIYRIRQEPGNTNEFSVYCQMNAHGGGWTVFQNRRDNQTDFYRNWNDYKLGFGDLNGNFWLGLERMHRLTSSKKYEILIELQDFEGETRYAIYDTFKVGSKNEGYPISELGTYRGTAGDSLSYHRGQKFSTRDVDNDGYSGNCAELYSAAWWYRECTESNLNGPYARGRIRIVENGIIWYNWRGNYYSLMTTRMSIRPRA